MIAQRNAPVTVADIVNWHSAFKIPVNEKTVIEQFDKCVSDCMTWLESLAYQQQNQQ